MRGDLEEWLRAATYDDEAFAALPERLCDALNLTSLLMGWIGSDSHLRMSLSHNYFDQANLSDYFKNWANRDPWQQAALADGVFSGKVSRFTDLVPTHLFSASEFYQDFLRPRGFDILYAASVQATSHLGMGALAMHRGPNQGDFTNEEMDELHRLAPHIEQLQKVRARIVETSLAEQGFAMVVDRLQNAALVLGEGGSLLQANRKGSQLLDGADLLRCDGTTVFGRRKVARWFDEAIKQATRAESPVSSSARFENNGGGGVVMTMLPLSGGGFERRAILAITFPQVLTVAHETALIQTFGFTKGEASVVRLLANAHNIEAIAHKRRTSRQTVRVQVRNAMIKTDCSRQAQLVDLVRQFVSVAAADIQPQACTDE